MFKLIFDKDVNFIKNNTPKVETLRLAHTIQILCLSTLNLINQRNVSHIKLSKYCHIDARLAKQEIHEKFFLNVIYPVCLSDLEITGILTTLFSVSASGPSVSYFCNKYSYHSVMAVGALLSCFGIMLTGLAPATWYLYGTMSVIVGKTTTKC